MAPATTGHPCLTVGHDWTSAWSSFSPRRSVSPGAAAAHSGAAAPAPGGHLLWTFPVGELGKRLVKPRPAAFLQSQAQHVALTQSFLWIFLLD